MLGVAAMAVQNALVQIALKDTPTTAVMTTNITRLMVDVGDGVGRGNAADLAKARERARTPASGHRRFCHRLRARCGRRSLLRPVVPHAANGPRCLFACVIGIVAAPPLSGAIEVRGDIFMGDARIETDSMGKVDGSRGQAMGCADATVARALQHRARPDAARDDHRVCNPEAVRGDRESKPAVVWTHRPTS